MRCHLDKGRLAFGPIVESGGVEVSAVRPDEHMRFRIDSDPIEQRLIPKRSVQFSPQNRLKIDDLFRSVVKDDAQRIRSDNLETHDAANRVCHRQTLLF